MNNKKNNKQINSPQNFIIYGKNSVLEALSGQIKIKKIWLDQRANDERLKEVESIASSKNISIIPSDKHKLFQITKTDNHRSVAAEIVLENIFDENFINQEYFDPRSKQEKPVSKLIIPVNVQDPHNLGAIIRSAYAFDFDGVIISDRKTASITSTVISSSAGAALSLPIIQIGNISQYIDKLQKNNFWVYAADACAEAKDYRDIEFDRNSVLLLGSEGEGIPQKLFEKSDFHIRIPMQFESLNVSVAAGILMSEIYQQNQKNKEAVI